MDTIYSLLKRAKELKEKSQVDSITPEEVGKLHEDTLAYIASLEQSTDGLGIKKVYQSKSAMEADTDPVGTNGKTLRYGQLVSIYDDAHTDSSENGNIYAYQKPGWLLMGKVSGGTSLSIAQELGDSATSVMSQSAVTKALKNVNATTEDGKSLEDVYGIVKGLSVLKRENDAINDKLTKNSEQLSVDSKENIALVPSLACEIAYAGNVGEVMKRQYMSRNDSYVGIALQVVAGEKYIASGVVTYILSTSEYRVLEKKDNVVADYLLIEIPADAENLFIHFKKSESYSLYKHGEKALKGIVTDLVKSDNDTRTVDLSTVQFIQGYSIYDRSWRKQNSSYVVDVSGYPEVEIITGFKSVDYALLQSVDYNNSALFATGEGRSKNIPANTTQTIVFPYDAKFLVFTSKDGMSNTLPLKVTLRKVEKTKYPNEVSYKDCGDVLVFGSSITEAALAPTSWAWIERLNDMIDAGLINLGRSGSSLQHNITTLLCNSSKAYSVDNVRQDTAFPLLMRTPFVMWNNDANGTPIGKKYTELLEKAYFATKSFGAKMLIGGEPWPDGALGNWNSRDYAKRAFLAAHKDVAGVVMSNYVKDHFIYEGYKGFSDTTFHPGYRFQTAMMCSYDFLKLLPLTKSVKMYKVRPTYYSGNPTLEQLTYDSTEERVKYFHAIGCGSQKGGNEGIGLSTAHADNSDFHSGEGVFDVPNGVNSQYGLCEIGELKKGRSVPFKTGH